MSSEVGQISEEKEFKGSTPEKESSESSADTIQSAENSSNKDNNEAANEKEVLKSNTNSKTMKTRSASLKISEKPESQELLTSAAGNERNSHEENVHSNENVVSEKTEEKLEDNTHCSSQNENSSKEVNSADEFILDSESYMDPLVLQSDEPCPELEFEDSSDKDSGQHSPIISRCVTRRSQNRNIPTPKTPKSIDDQDMERGSTPTDSEDVPKVSLLKDFNETDNSNTDTLSTEVQVGSDATRLQFSEGESDFLIGLKNRTRDTLPRCVSSRRSIKSMREDIRRKSLRNSIQKGNLSIPFFSSRDSVERAPSVKRRSRSETPEERKRFKEDSSSVLSKITSPFNSLKMKFSGGPNSTSTPKLTSYRDQKNHLGGDFIDQMGLPGGETELERKWCSIM